MTRWREITPAKIGVELETLRPDQLEYIGVKVEGPYSQSTTDTNLGSGNIEVDENPGFLGIFLICNF